MFPHIYGDFGSVQKFLSGVESRKELTLNQWLNSKVYSYFPKKVQKLIPSTNKRITFRDLLRHKSGIRGKEDKNAYETFMRPVKSSNYQKRSYHNSNFKILTYLIPVLHDKKLLKTMNTLATTLNWSGKSINFVNHIGPRFTSIINKENFQKTKPKMFGTCSPRKDLVRKGKGVAKMYTFKKDPNLGVIANDPKRHCVAQGGWYYSSKGMAIFMANLIATDKIIHRSTYKDLYDYLANSFERDQRLIYNREIMSPYLTNLTGWQGFPSHGGTMNRSRKFYVGGPAFKNGSSRAAIIRLPRGYSGIVHTNSSEMSSTALATEIKNSFAEALK